VRASLVIGSGWQNGNWLPGTPDGTGNQRLNVSNSKVNDNEYDFVSAAGSDFTPTCDLPAADIRLTKSDPTPDGIINEAPVQQNLVDNGTAFRVVDCKYQYILSIPALKTATNPTIAGTYRIEILIDGNSPRRPPHLVVRSRSTSSRPSGLSKPICCAEGPVARPAFRYHSSSACPDYPSYTVKMIVRLRGPVKAPRTLPHGHFSARSSAA
jgi:hypothetical protein